VIKKLENNQNYYLAIAAIAFGVSYGLYSWSVDSGSIILYVLTAVSFLYGIYITKEWIISFINHEGTSKTNSSRRAKKAHRAK
jgi:hypothetical protein